MKSLSQAQVLHVIISVYTLSLIIYNFIIFYLDADIPQNEQDSYDNNPLHTCTSVCHRTLRLLYFSRLLHSF